MEFNEEELENVKAGYSANDNLENLAEMLYNKALIRNETMGKGTMTMPIIYTTSGQLKEMGIELNQEELVIVYELLCSRIEAFNEQVSRGR